MENSATRQRHRAESQSRSRFHIAEARDHQNRETLLTCANDFEGYYRRQILKQLCTKSGLGKQAGNRHIECAIRQLAA